MTSDEFDDDASRYRRTMQIDELRRDEIDYDVPTAGLFSRRAVADGEERKPNGREPAIK